MTFFYQTLFSNITSLTVSMIKKNSSKVIRVHFRLSLQMSYLCSACLINLFYKSNAIYKNFHQDANRVSKIKKLSFAKKESI